MSFWTLDRVAQALRDDVTGAVPRGRMPFGAVSTDTRTVAPGDLFVALRGERFDAHDFLADAVRAGAAALVISDAARARGLGVATYVVRDTLRALGALGRYRRRAWSGAVVAVAGSNGKTGTKELIRAALGGMFEVHATTGNLNNQVGAPLTLLAIPDAAQVAIVEIGTNQPGEVERLRAIVEPDIAVVTSIGEEHLEGFGSVEGVLREESAVFSPDSVAICPAAQPEVARAARRMTAAVIEAGLDTGDVKADAWGTDEQGRPWIRLGDVRVEVPLRGAHNARNAMLAIAVARSLGVSDEVAARGIATMPALPMRSAWLELGALTVINDAYNANPASAREALALLDSISAERQRVVVLGSMLELGAQSAALHEEIARRALSSRAHLVAGVGEFARVLESLAQGTDRVVTAPDAEALWPKLAARLHPSALVLLKGSRGMRLERLMPHLATFAGVASPASTAASH